MINTEGKFREIIEISETVKLIYSNSYLHKKLTDSFCIEIALKMKQNELFKGINRWLK